MQFIIAFLEGVITFISPCLLPMLPVYISYFAGGNKAKGNKALVNAVGFVMGFTIVFISLGALAGTIGSFLKEYQVAVNIILGMIVIFFGLDYLGVFRLNIFKGGVKAVDTGKRGFFSSVIFGMIFSVGWTPCVGAFLGSALMLASLQGHVAEGMLMLLVYSFGLGIPFILSAMLIDYLTSAFDFIKRHYRIINIVSGSLLIVVGVLMATGMLGKFLGLLS